MNTMTSHDILKCIEPKNYDLFETLGLDTCIMLGTKISEILDILLDNCTECDPDSGLVSFPDDKMKELCKLSSFLLHFAEKSTMDPIFLLESVEKLHELLISLYESDNSSSQLKSTIAKICEVWWLRKFEGRNCLMPQLLSYLLLTLLSSECRTQDIKRLLAVKEAFFLLDFEDDSIQTIQGLILRLFIHPQVLKVQYVSHNEIFYRILLFVSFTDI
jgi:hypothetical protein